LSGVGQAVYRNIRGPTLLASDRRAQKASNRDRFQNSFFKLVEILMTMAFVPVEVSPRPFSELSRDMRASGVYFLFADEKVVYVGQTCSVLRRIGEHMSDRTKRFDGFAWLPCLALNRLWLESNYIDLLKPLYNLEPNHKPARSRRRASQRVRRRKQLAVAA
jgi:hypothetical protein